MVLADSKYKQLLKILKPEEAERVLAFVETAGPSSQRCLTLAPDASKAHRTKVTFDPTWAPPSNLTPPFY